MTLYDIGDSVRLDVVFTDRDGVVTDPSTITLLVRSPKGTKSTYTYAGGQVQRSGTGAYYYDITASEAGTWRYSFTGSGALVVSEETRFEVQRRYANE